MFETAFYLAVILFVFGLAAQFFRFKKQSRALDIDCKADTGFNLSGAILNTLFQVRLFKAGKIRWAFHILLLAGFFYLTIVHGLYSVTADLFFDDYQPTLDPFQALRNIGGALVLAGCLSFVIRRFVNLRVNRVDRNIQYKGLLTVGLILMVIVSGFLLEAAKIVSEPIFMEMVEEYSGIGDEQELADLKVFWQEKYSVVFEDRLSVSEGALKSGQVLNEDNCLYCHSPVRSAAVSHQLAQIIAPVGRWLNATRADRTLYWIHYLLCLSLLVTLPFSRLSHIFLIPFASSRKAATTEYLQDSKAVVPAATLTACTNCGYCSNVCSVYPNYQIHQNPDILPHAKIESIKHLIETPGRVDIRKLHAGNSACTLCHNCTDICPSGIDLQSLWLMLDDHLTRMGVPDTIDLIKKIPLNEWNHKEYTAQSKSVSEREAAKKETYGLADQTRSFENCIQCTVCTNVCPVVDYDADLNDMTPHQIMNLLRLDKKHLATGTRMVWSCLTCYACQENCPQEIRVTDILIELRNAGGVKARTIQNDQTRDKDGR